MPAAEIATIENDFNAMFTRELVQLREAFVEALKALGIDCN